jgi:uncharacterized protein YhbP (UPF0306 family)
MEKLDIKIVKFIKKHHVLTLATSIAGKPWCANCFYAYLEQENILIFTSDMDTRHIKEAADNPKVAGSIVLETKIIGKIQGIQFEGVLKFSECDEYKKCYLKRFPFAILTNTPIWFVDLEHLKLTDNRLGFGKKIIWKKD